MNFFKMTKFKVIFTFILFLPIFLIILYSRQCIGGIICVPYGLLLPWSYMALMLYFLIAGLPVVILSNLIFKVSAFFDMIIGGGPFNKYFLDYAINTALALPLLLLWNYLIVCIILYLYNRLKKQ